MRLLGLLMVLLVSGCLELEPPEERDDVPEGPDDPLTLEAEFREIVETAKTGDADAVATALQEHLATEADLKAVFGEAGAAAWPGYREKISEAVRREAGRVIVEQVGRGLTEVEVEPVGPVYPERTTPGDQQMLDAMVEKRPMYTVRLHAPGEELGLRLNGFVFRDGRWVAMLKTYDHFPE